MFLSSTLETTAGNLSFRYVIKRFSDKSVEGIEVGVNDVASNCPDVWEDKRRAHQRIQFACIRLEVDAILYQQETLEQLT